MTKEEFIKVIRVAVVDTSVHSVESALTKPTGREPSNSTMQSSTWFNNLGPEDKNMVMKVVKEAIETGVFGFLCVLDGVRAIENTQTKGQLILTYVKQNITVVLNDPNEDYLHDLL